MNSTCTHCGTVFRVDPAKVPAGGVRARCSICRKVFAVGTEQSGADSDGGAPDTRPQSTPAADAPAVPGVQTHSPHEASSEQSPDAAEATERPDIVPAPAVPAPDQETPQRAAPAPRPTPPAFGSSDPDAKARRLARALVSDMVTYHPDRRDAALAAGTLKKEFREEITKSWEEYVEQVGKERAMQTPHFRNALNEILARGQTVF
jgi:predicted Zn finger-like uncharacterized protein